MRRAPLRTAFEALAAALALLAGVCVAAAPARAQSLVVAIKDLDGDTVRGEPVTTNIFVHALATGASYSRSVVSADGERFETLDPGPHYVRATLRNSAGGRDDAFTRSYSAVVEVGPGETRVLIPWAAMAIEPDAAPCDEACLAAFYRDHRFEICGLAPSATYGGVADHGFDWLIADRDEAQALLDQRRAVEPGVWAAAERGVSARLSPAGQSIFARALSVPPAERLDALRAQIPAIADCYNTPPYEDYYVCARDSELIGGFTSPGVQLLANEAGYADHLAPLERHIDNLAVCDALTAPRPRDVTPAVRVDGEWRAVGGEGAPALGFNQEFRLEARFDERPPLDAYTAELSAYGDETAHAARMTRAAHDPALYISAPMVLRPAGPPLPERTRERGPGEGGGEGGVEGGSASPSAFTLGDFLVEGRGYQLSYEDAALGTVTGRATVRDGALDVRLEDPRDDRVYDLASGYIRIEGDTLVAPLRGASPSGETVPAPAPVSTTDPAVVEIWAPARSEALMLTLERHVERAVLEPHRGPAPEDDVVTVRLRPVTGPDGGPLWSGVWTFQADPETRRDASGDGRQGGFDQTAGLMSGAETWTPVIRRVLHVGVLTEQTARDAAGAVYPYRAEGGRRLLAVFGSNLPRSSQGLDADAGGRAVVYRLRAHSDDASIGAEDRALIDRARAYAASRGFGADPRLAGAEIMIVEAVLGADQPPGHIPFVVEGQASQWPLLYGDAAAEVRFVRALDGARFERLDQIPAPATVYVAIRAAAELPVESLPVTLETVGADGVRVPAALTGGELVARRSPDAPRAYLTAPFVVGTEADIARIRAAMSEGAAEGGDDAAPARALVLPQAQGAGLGVIAARIEDAAYLDHFYVALADRAPRFAAVVARPPPGALWAEALEAAARCHGVSTEGQDLHAAEVQESLWSLTVNLPVSFVGVDGVTVGLLDPVRATDVTLGHHAGMLLLRNEYLRQVEPLAAELERMAGAGADETAQRLAALQARRLADAHPLNLVPLIAPGGAPVPFGFLSWPDAELAQYFDISAADAAAWREAAYRDALLTLAQASRASAASARAASCDVERLLELTGRDFGSIEARVTPRLVRPNPATGAWEPDRSARAWTSSVADLGEEYRARRTEASIDTAALMAQLGVVLGVAVAEGSTAAVLAESALAGADSYAAWSDYFAGRRELAFALGAAPVIGPDRYAAAEATAMSIEAAVMSSVLAAAGPLAAGAQRFDDVARVSREALEAETLRAYRATLAAEPDRYVLGRLDDFDGAPTSVLEGPPAPGGATARLPGPGAGDDLTMALPAGDGVPGSTTIDVPAAGGASDDAVQAGQTNILVDPETRRPVDVTLGEELGGGAGTTAYAHPTDPERVIRVSEVSDDAGPLMDYDRYGRAALEELGEGSGGVVTATARHSQRELVTADGRRVLVEEVERVVPASDQIAAQGGTMSQRQREALDAAMRYLNRNGYVWTDGKPANFSFVPLDPAAPDGPVGVRILDTGGVFQVRLPGGAPIASDPGAAYEIARRVQRTIDAPSPSWVSRYQAVRARTLDPDLPSAERAAARAEQREMIVARQRSVGAVVIGDLDLAAATSGEPWFIMTPTSYVDYPVYRIMAQRNAAQADATYRTTMGVDPPLAPPGG